MRRTCLQCIYELAKIDKRIFFVGSDCGPDVAQEFKHEMPERWLMEGISEANVTGLAAGLALEGYIPYVHTIAPFLTRRNYDQIAIDLCEQNLPVRLVSGGAGLVYASLGPTHLAVDDLALLRPLPNMTIIAPADAQEMRRVMTETLDVPGPVYIRIARGWEPVVTDDRRFEIGRGYRYRSGRDALILTTGVTLSIGLAAADALLNSDIIVSVMHVPTVKPFDEEQLLDAAKEVPLVVSVEEHQICGGLGSAMAELLAEAGLSHAPKLHRIGIRDVFPAEYGSQETCMARHGITREKLIETILEIRSDRAGASDPIT